MIPWLQNILNRIGKNDDAAAMDSTLFAGQQKIADDIAGLPNSIPTAVPAADSTANAQMRDVAGNKEDAATYAISTEKSIISYVKGIIGWLAVTAADDTNNYGVTSTVGNKEDTAQTVVGTTRSLMGYVKGILNVVNALPTTSPAPIICLIGSCDAGMSASATSIVSDDLKGYGDDYFNNKFWLGVLKNANSAGNAPEMEVRQITDYVSSTGTFTTGAFSANLEAGDDVIVLHESLPFWKTAELTSGSGNWTVPKGVSLVDVVIVGGGGAGGGHNAASTPGGGGGGGETVALYNFNVAGKTTVPYAVGAGGTGGTGSGGNGGSSSFESFIAGGGYGGATGSGTQAGNGGGTSPGTGGTTQASPTAGGAGSISGNVIVNRYSGAGGGGGCTGSSDGAAGGASFSSGGAGGSGSAWPAGGGGGGSWGRGATGAAGGEAGNSAGANSGGGGGGASGTVLGARNGGSGGSGYIRIMWR